jgi:hypothetical protein
MRDWQSVSVPRMDDEARYVAPWELDGVAGVVVAVDVLRAFTTAAYTWATRLPDADIGHTANVGQRGV